MTFGLLVAALLALPLVAYLAQDRLIFFPQPMAEAQRERIARGAPGVESLFLQAADGTRPHAWHVKAGERAPLVVYFGGNAEDVSWMIDVARRHAPQVSWLLVDYRGYGASHGAPSEETIVADALAWYDHAASVLRPAKAFVFGRSLGGGAAIRVAAERGTAGVVLVAPFDSLVEVAKRYYPYLPVRLLLKHRFDSIALAPRIQAPLLCLVAGADEVIPPAHSRRLFEAWGGPKRWVLLEGAGHNSTDGAPLFWEHIGRFIADR